MIMIKSGNPMKAPRFINTTMQSLWGKHANAQLKVLGSDLFWSSLLGN